MGRKRNDDWVDSALKVGLGVLALYFLKKLTEPNKPAIEKNCTFCGQTAQKWARACSNCRNTFPL